MHQIKSIALHYMGVGYHALLNKVCLMLLLQVYDSINACKLLDVKDYLVGVVLPPHLSPFVEEGEDDYVPPERVQLLQRAQDEGELVPGQAAVVF